jgi:hypothetical protein
MFGRKTFTNPYPPRPAPRPRLHHRTAATRSITDVAFIIVFVIVIIRSARAALVLGTSLAQCEWDASIPERINPLVDSSVIVRVLFFSRGGRLMIRRRRSLVPGGGGKDDVDSADDDSVTGTDVRSRWLDGGRPTDLYRSCVAHSRSVKIFHRWTSALYNTRTTKVNTCPAYESCSVPRKDIPTHSPSHSIMAVARGWREVPTPGRNS